MAKMLWVVMQMHDWNDFTSNVGEMHTTEDFGVGFLKVFEDLETAERYYPDSQIVAVKLGKDEEGE